MSWDYAKPSQENNEDCLPCLFIQFCVIENGRRVSKILQIFSRQAVQMDALINTFVDELKQRVAMYNEDHDGNVYGDSTSTDADGKIPTISLHGFENILKILLFPFRLSGATDHSFSKRYPRILSQ